MAHSFDLAFDVILDERQDSVVFGVEFVVGESAVEWVCSRLHAGVAAIPDRNDRELYPCVLPDNYVFFFTIVTI
ncbi:hypothetical protein [Halococcus salsus]|uniref:hypothetical protein n=1 Tax=Halococcus salsus TaxID=2162894 RepID=UPI00135CF62A|nr:hypothetical protein [Halococcus salsus]